MNGGKLDRERQEADERERALARYRECLPLFEARAHAAKELIEPLSKLLRIQKELSAKRQAAVDELSELCTRAPVQFKKHVDQLRERALLPDDFDIGLPPAKTDGEALAETVAMLLDLGILGPGYVRKSASFPSILGAEIKRGDK